LVEFSKENESCVSINTYKKLQFNRKKLSLALLSSQGESFSEMNCKGTLFLGKKKLMIIFHVQRKQTHK